MSNHKHKYRFKRRVRVGLLTHHYLLIFRCDRCRNVCRIAPGELWKFYI